MNEKSVTNKSPFKIKIKPMTNKKTKKKENRKYKTDRYNNK